MDSLQIYGGAWQERGGVFLRVVDTPMQTVYSLVANRRRVRKLEQSGGGGERVGLKIPLNLIDLFDF